jgi:6-phosphogluconolactonase
MKKLHIAADTQALSAELAEWIKDLILDTLHTKDRFTFVLSGGSTPKALYQLLASDAYRTSIPWEKVHFFYGDERAVPFEDERNNAKMSYDTLLNFIEVPTENIHIMRTDLDPMESAVAYEAVLNTYFGEEEYTFDLVLLGMGDDGHTLSLFPGTEVVHEEKAWATAFFLKAQDMYRITLTAPVVNKSRYVAFLTTGSGKAATLKEVLEGPFEPDRLPSQVITAGQGEVHWFVDEAAAAQLSV